MTTTLGRRVARLEQWLAPDRGYVVVVQFTGPGSERFPQPTPEQLADARHILRVNFVPAKDGHTDGD